MNKERLMFLIGRYFDGALDAETQSELEEELLASREARVRFWEAARLEEALRTNGAEARGVSRVAPMEKPRSVVRWWRKPLRVAAAAILLSGLGFAGYRQLHPPVVASTDEPDPGEVAEIHALALMERTSDAVWKDDGGPLPEQTLDARPRELDRGIAVIGFFSGARVTVEGPARFTLVSQESVDFQEGYAEVSVPNVAQGFSVSLRGARIVSQGGTFEIRSSKTSTEIRPGTGRLRVDGLPNGPQELAAGEYLSLPESGTPVRGLSPNPLRAIPLSRVLDQRSQDKLAQWRTACDQRDRDPSLLVHLRMDAADDEASNLLTNSAGNPAADRSAPVIGAKWVSGRWPGKQALSFRNDNARVRIAIPGTCPRATFAAWVQVEEFRKRLNAIFLSQPEIPGETHWQFSTKGEFRFSVRPATPLPNKIFLRAYGKPMLGTPQQGMWKFLATSYDADTRTVIQYVDGREALRTKLAQSVPLQFGAATIGNCAIPPPDWYGVRPFGGVIDEFMLYSRALGPEEISKLYDEGRPD